MSSAKCFRGGQRTGAEVVFGFDPLQGQTDLSQSLHEGHFK
jgi:hypothetical protein